MVGRARTVAVVGLDAVDVTVEAHAGNGLPGFHVIGSSGSAAGQAAERVRTALAASEIQVPSRKMLLSLAPADVPKAGARFDLAMAAAVLAEFQALPEGVLDGVVLLGELSLDGTVRPVPGVLPSAASLAGRDVRLFVADGNAAEAGLVAGLAVVGVADLREVVAILIGEASPRPTPAPSQFVSDGGPDLADVRGQDEARRALEIAAAGGHHLLLLGPPGCGKSMLARRLPSVLPKLSDEHALELAAVRSVAGRGSGHLDRTPPFRAPHHGVSAAAMFGGGSGVARPGEISLAHRGVLFLDELFEWPRSVVEALRQPLEDGVVRVARSRATVTYPALLQLVCAANPCPCGGGDRCSCTDEAVPANHTDSFRYFQRPRRTVTSSVTRAWHSRRTASEVDNEPHIPFVQAGGVRPVRRNPYSWGALRGLRTSPRSPRGGFGSTNSPAACGVGSKLAATRRRTFNRRRVRKPSRSDRGTRGAASHVLRGYRAECEARSRK